MVQKIGLITIGQSPRSDMTPEMAPLLGQATTLIEAGALDELSEAEIAKLAPGKDEVTYVSRLRNGTSAKLSKPKLLPYLQQKLTEVEAVASNSIIVCTGSFPTLNHTKPLLFPDQILKHVVQSVIGSGKLGLIVPLEEQKAQLVDKWGDIPLVVAAASPYEETDFEGPARELKEKGTTLFVLDCMGYTEAHKRTVKTATGIPTILSRSVVARIASELA
ncbi:AroM family protein [Alkalihalobacillus sp. TS-13]|uniref:AroM family protein n=1 Tax=Alkalihalobacillus sp. TS-13 TaxID=2842455 RepID=UPI001C876729|nr:AroM family protein [Alkalihalobacillus sp. TS-13]